MKKRPRLPLCNNTVFYRGKEHLKPCSVIHYARLNAPPGRADVSNHSGHFFIVAVVCSREESGN